VENEVVEERPETLSAGNPLEELAIGVIIAQRMYVCEDGHLHVPRKPPACVAKLSGSLSKEPSRIVLP